MIAAVIILSCLSFLLSVCFFIILIVWLCEKDENYKYWYSPPKIDYSSFARFSQSSNEDSEEEDATETVS